MSLLIDNNGYPNIVFTNLYEITAGPNYVDGDGGLGGFNVGAEVGHPLGGLQITYDKDPANTTFGATRLNAIVNTMSPVPPIWVTAVDSAYIDFGSGEIVATHGGITYQAMGQVLIFYDISQCGGTPPQGQWVYDQNLD